jgi:pyruvate formate-lyase activating enzyme-like uncharacterized protein
MENFADTLFAALGRNAFCSPRASSPEMDTLPATWAAHVERVRQEAPYAVVEDAGETVFTGALSPGGGLSPGCRACKAGAWDCFFLTDDCNLACPFCCSPAGHGTQPALSALGRDIDQAIANLRIACPQGISFSGGEVFLEFERLRSVVTRIRREFPDAYLWAYTNGLLANGEKLAELGQIGLDEIRFNLAASGYRSPRVLRHLEQAVRSIPHVTVEIPAIPEHSDRLLPAIPVWADAGVQYLNLHELMYEPGSLSDHLPGPRQALRTPDGHVTAFHPQSRGMVLRVMQEIQEAGLPLAVNDCSMQNKLRQVRGRRALMGRLVQDRPGSMEILRPNGLLETICVFNRQGQAVFIHPDSLEEVREEYTGWLLARLWREPPLSIYEPVVWSGWEELGGGELP